MEIAFSKAGWRISNVGEGLQWRPLTNLIKTDTKHLAQACVHIVQIADFTFHSMQATLFVILCAKTKISQFSMETGNIVKMC